MVSYRFAPTASVGAITTLAGSSTYGIGYADSADGTGINTTANTLELKYTANGDANLDGTVNLADSLALSRHFGQTGGWEAGDSNYDGLVNLWDLLTLTRNFGKSLPPTLPATDLVLPKKAVAPLAAVRRV